MNKVYTRIAWENYPSLKTPINEQNLNKLDFALDSLDNRIINLDTAKVNEDDIQTNIADWSIDIETGIITITRVNGDVITFDLNIEKIPIDFKLTKAGILLMTTDDGTQFSADIGSMIPILTFETSDEIKVTTSGEGINKTYSFSIIDKSIDETKLKSNYLANIKEETAKADNFAKSASDSATLAKSYAVGSTGTRENENTDNAKYYAEQAKAASNVIDDSNATANNTTFSASKISALTNVEENTNIMTEIQENNLGDVTLLQPLYKDSSTGGFIKQKLNNYVTNITSFLTTIVDSLNKVVVKCRKNSSDISTVNDTKINNIYADSSHAYPLICKDIQAGQVTVEQAVKDAVANGFFSTNGAYIGLIIHGSWEFYTAIAVNDAKYISVLIHGYSGEIHQLVWSGRELVNHRVL